MFSITAMSQRYEVDINSNLYFQMDALNLFERVNSQVYIYHENVCLFVIQNNYLGQYILIAQSYTKIAERVKNNLLTDVVIIEAGETKYGNDRFLVRYII